MSEHLIDVFSSVLAFIRGLLIYTEQKHVTEKYFLCLYLIVKLIFPQMLFYFMFIGYLVIGVILFQEDKNSKERNYFIGKDEAVGTGIEVET